MTDVLRPYIIYLTQVQEEELKKLFSQSDWKIGIFKCIHQDMWHLVDLIIQQEELDFDSIGESKHNKGNIFKGQKRICSKISTNVTKSQTSERNVFYTSNELDRPNDNEKRKIISSGGSSDNCSGTFDLQEGKHEDTRVIEGEADQKNSIEEYAIQENLQQGTNSSRSVQDKGFVEISGIRNKELKSPVSDDSQKVDQRECLPKYLINNQSKCDIGTEHNECIESVNEDDISDLGTIKTGKVVNYNFRQRRYMDRLKLFQSPNICKQQDRFICGKPDKISAREKSLKYNKGRKDLGKAKNGKEEIKQQIVPEVIACKICRKSFADKYSLSTHHVNMHSEEQRVYQCDLCGAVLKHMGNLVQHKKSLHGGTRTHCCDICGNSFKLYQHLKTHKRRHDPSFVETCTICGKTLRKGHLSSHMKRHSNDKNFQCNTCGKKFVVKQDLERHVILHSGEKPHKCLYCPYACALKGNLTKHLNKRHKLKNMLHVSNIDDNK